MFLIFDDIFDGSITRRGQLCWYKLKDIQLLAVNDAFMIDAGIYQILKEHFSHKDCYVKLLELFYEMSLVPCIGQYLDTKPQNQNVLTFTMVQYKAIATHKTGYASYFPVAAALHLAGYSDPENFEKAKTILIEIGNHFQIQDDIIDCFGDPKVTGKIGTDIKDGKCSWLSAVCVARATEAQKEVLKEHFGKDDPKAVARIKQLYEELSLPDIYTTYEKDTYNLIKMQIQEISHEIPAEIFLFHLDKIFKRTT